MRGSLRRACAALLAGAACAVGGGPAMGENVAATAWLQHGGDVAATRFSALDQVDRANVSRLRLKWAAELGFTGRVQGSPAAWNGLLFVSTDSGLVALAAEDGTRAWQYAERSSEPGSVLPVRAPRGSPVVVEAGDGTAVVYASLPHAPAVVALDARSGELRWRTDVGDPAYAEALRTNPLLAGGLLVVGPTGADLSAAPGRLVALDPAAGEVAWTFDLVPVDDDDPARSTWAPYPPGLRFGVGGGSAWNAGAYDPRSGLVVFGTGQPIPSDRIDPRRNDGDGPPSADLYTSSFVALDAVSGELRWFHQVVPADEWGFDQHTVPMFIDHVVEGVERRVALLATTTGFVLLLEAESGELLRAHAMAEPRTVHVGYSEDGAPLIDDAARRLSADDIVRVCPGTRWANIAPAAFSPATGLLYRPNDLACVRQGAGGMPDDWQPGGRPSWLLSEVRFEGDHFERWGALTAIDPGSGAVAWSFETPYPHDAGALATAGGLVFSAFADRRFRAFDAYTGEVLWSTLLAAHSDAAPITYAVDGVQYVAVLAGRDAPTPSLPASGLPASEAGPAVLYVFALTD